MSWFSRWLWGRDARAEGERRRRRAYAPPARGSILGSLIMDERRTGSRLAWRAPLWAALALLLYQVQSGVRVHSPWVSLDFTAIFLAFFVLRLGLIEGALAAFSVGYLAVLFHGPPGLGPFLAVLLWTGSHLLLPRHFLSGWLGASLFVFCLSALHGAGSVAGDGLISGHGTPWTGAGLGILGEAGWSALATVPFHAFLGRIERRTSGRSQRTQQR